MTLEYIIAGHLLTLAVVGCIIIAIGMHKK